LLKNKILYIIAKKFQGLMMAQLPENIGCENEECIAKDECKRQVIVKEKTAVEIREFGGTADKKCGKFIQK
jgi:aspartate carbamoyltransferase regulatory subunit